MISTLTAKELLFTDGALIENIQSWIIAMSSSTLRPFRHTSTIISFSILTTLCDIAAELRKANMVSTRQLDAENKKPKKNEPRIASLEAKIKSGEERREVVEGIIKDIFDAVFVHRYRDIDPRIRTDCVHELGTWILKLPDLFFDGTYLRYLGWVLSDISPFTRLEVVRALLRIFRSKDNVMGMRNFTERFRTRLVEIATMDADSSVRCTTIELLDVVRTVGFLEPSDVDVVGRLIFDLDPRVRKAVVGFFVKNIEDLSEDKIEDLGGPEAFEEGMANAESQDEDYGGPRIAWIKMKCLAEVLATYDESPEDEETRMNEQNLSAARRVAIHMREAPNDTRFSIAGTALWDNLDEVSDWEGLAKYLIYDHSAARMDQSDSDEGPIEERVKKICALDSREEGILLQVLHSSIAATIGAGEVQPAKGGQKRVGFSWFKLA